MNKEFLDYVDVTPSPFETEEGRSFGNYVKRDNWLRQGSSIYVNHLVIVEKAYTHKDKLTYKCFTSGPLKKEKELIIGILRETKIPKIYFVNLVDFKKNKLKWAKISEKKNEKRRKKIGLRSKKREKYIEQVNLNPNKKNLFSNIKEGTYKNTALYNLENILYKDKLVDNKKNLSGIKSLKTKSWMFRDQDIEKLENGTIESRYFLQIEDKFERSIEFYNNKKFDKVYLYDDVINHKDVLNHLCSKYNDINILAAFQSLIEKKVIEDFPYNLKDRFRKYIDFV